MMLGNCEADDFNGRKQIGKGAFGTVFKAKHKDTKLTVAIKYIDDVVFENAKEERKVAWTKKAANEGDLLRKLDGHPNIVKLLGAYTSQKLPYLVMEFVPCTLKRFLSESGPGLEVDVRKSVVYQIGQGLLYVHERGMMHRDLKPDNILVVEEPLTVKIADFGHAREGVNAKGGLTNAVCTHGYCAPEVLLGADNYTQLIDVWSYGCVLGEVFLGYRLFPCPAEEKDRVGFVRICHVIGTPTVEEWPDLANFEHFRYPKHAQNRLPEVMRDSVDRRGLKLLKKTLSFNPAKRPTMKAVLSHAFFSTDLDKSTLPLGDWTGGPLPAPEPSHVEDAHEEEDEENHPPAAKKIKAAVNAKAKTVAVPHKLDAPVLRRRLAARN